MTVEVQLENRIKPLKERCHVNTNDDGDRFVGIKADSEYAMVYFPIGYQLPENEQDIRRDIIQLISVLSEFRAKDDRVLHINKYERPQTVNFPINAYLEVLNYYLVQNAYYTEKEPVYKSSDRGNTDWAKTIQKKKPLLQANYSPVYLEHIVRDFSPNEKKLITQIHKYCVYESFQALGWLFTPNLPQKPDFPIDISRFIIELNDRLGRTNNDRDKRLFVSMISMLRYIDETTNAKQFYFGTDTFEYVWEKLIDQVFGVSNKRDYFPKASWKLKKGVDREFEALIPDTIMIYDGKYYVLDAKYYRYGITGNQLHLPEGKSIHKQITYGEYISNSEKWKLPNGKKPTVYNAFLMPYNPADNIFGINGLFENIGEATGEWKENKESYEQVQGILVDINYLIHHYVGNHKTKIMMLAKSIENALYKKDN